jgi:hypothetical protein
LLEPTLTFENQLLSLLELYRGCNTFHPAARDNLLAPEIANQHQAPQSNLYDIQTVSAAKLAADLF